MAQIFDPSPTLLHVRELCSPRAFGSVSMDDVDWWRGCLVYQIYPRSFQDHNGDGIGDLIGIMERLDYIAALGVDAVWICPFFRSPMKDFGYDVSNYRKVDPLFGTMDDFDGLVTKAHSLGLKIIVDIPISHTSDKHEWFIESRSSQDNPKANWYVWADPKPDGSPPNNWLSIFGGVAWHWCSTRLQYYLHNFLTCQPDLNFHCPQVQEAVLKEAEFWLDRGVDGFRLDTVNFYFHSSGLESNPPVKLEDYNDMTAPAVNPYNFQEHVYDKSRPENLEFLAKLRALTSKYRAAILMGEIGDSQHQLELLGSYTSGAERLHMAYTFNFLGGPFKADHFAKSILDIERFSPNGWMCHAFSNHDVVRHITRWGSDISSPVDKDNFAKLCASILLCLRGSVCIYQGEELGLGEADLSLDELVDPYGIEFWPKYKGRDGCRTPMPWQSAAPHGGFTSAPKSWLPVPSSHLSHAVNVQEADANSVLMHYRKMINFRKRHLALAKGSIQVLQDLKEGMLGFKRTFKHESLLCLFNMSPRSLRYRLDDNVEVIPLDSPGSENASLRKDVIDVPAFSSFVGLLD